MNSQQWRSCGFVLNLFSAQILDYTGQLTNRGRKLVCSVPDHRVSNHMALRMHEPFPFLI